jgi:hypothetical protein
MLWSAFYRAAPNGRHVGAPMNVQVLTAALTKSAVSCGITPRGRPMFRMKMSPLLSKLGFFFSLQFHPEDEGDMSLRSVH